MKKLETIIHPQNWDQTRAVLSALKLSATLREVKTFGHTPPRREVYRGSAYTLETTPELELTLLVQDEALEATLTALGEVTGNVEILVTPVEYLLRIGNVQSAPQVAPRAVALVRAMAAPHVAAIAVRA